MGVFLSEIHHGIHVSSCVIPMDRRSICDVAVQYCRFVRHVFHHHRQVNEVGVRFTLGQVTFSPHRLQLFLEPTRSVARCTPYRMAPNYECTSPLLVVLEMLIVELT